MSGGQGLLGRWAARMGGAGPRTKSPCTTSPRVSGPPPSANGASSFHLWWLGLPTGVEVSEAAVTLEVTTPPAVPRLYFWALQVAFVDGAVRTGAGHLGLQWHPGHPGSKAVNWGGYRHGGGELDGTPSSLPSTTANPNTRDLPWAAARPYRLAIARTAEGRWRGSVDGKVIRDLIGGGRSLADVVVWAEFFAHCDDPPVEVRWSGLEVRSATGERRAPDRVRVSYQDRGAGGCDNTTVATDGAGGILQRTASPRLVPAGAELAVGPAS
ncbi:hypothetical protein BH24ACT3_BH24ACT3_18460 [soil metagenome]